VVWQDASPGKNILHGQWSNPSYGNIGGRAQVIFPGGDGRLYSFEPRSGRLLWKFDGNPSGAVWRLGGTGDKNNILATPVIHGNRIYFGMGQDPEHGDGPGRFYVLAPEQERELPESAVVWQRTGEQFYRTLSTAAVAQDLVYIADLSGYLYCLDAGSGELYWTHDTLAAVWGSPYVVDGKVILGDEEGDVVVLRASKDKQLLHEVAMGSSIYSTPVASNETLYIATRSRLFAIARQP
jgi:outer membrane protein assembly factor BamB